MKRSKVNMADCMRGFLVVLKIVGLAPFSPNSRHQVLLIIYQGINILIVIYLCVAALFLHNAFEENSLSTLVSVLVFVTLIVAHLVILMQALLTRKNQKEVFDMLTEIDSQFHDKLSVNVPVKQLNKKYAIGFVLMVSVLLVNDLALTLSKIFHDNIYGFAHSFFSRQILRFRIFQSMLYVQMATDRLKLLNDKLLEIITSRRTTPSFIILEGEYGKYKHGAKSSQSNERILNLKQIFGNIWELTNVINECFGWSLLAIVTSYFMDFTSNGYWLFLALEKLLGQNAILECLCDMIPLAFMLSLLSWFCNSCKQMSETTGSLVHKLEKSTESEQYNALVSEFSLQVMHEPINLSANGFFTIDFELLGSMGAATVTYLVILIQFLLNETNQKSASVKNTTDISVI